MTEDNKHIIVECQKGNRGAQQAIYEWLSPKMYAVCLRYTRNQDEAEDCLQDGFIKVFTKIDTFEFKGSFEGWVRRIVVNTIIESFRKRNPTTRIDDIGDLPEGEMTESESPASNLDMQFLHNLIQKLPPQYRIVFSLYVIEEMSHEEISQQLGISVGTSKSNLFRARKWLQQKIDQLNLNERNRYVNAS